MADVVLIPHHDSRLNRPRGHPVVLRVAELALRNRIATIAEIAAVETHLDVASAITDTCIERRERRGERPGGRVFLTGAPGCVSGRRQASPPPRPGISKDANGPPPPVSRGPMR